MTYLDGIDISKWQSTTPSLAGLSFAFARATYATTIDPKYATHVANFRRAGIVVGAYHFGVGHKTVTAQVKAFLNAAKGADLFILDLERDSTKTMTQAEAREFIRLVHAASKKIGLYHSRSGFPDFGQDYNWVAQWRSTPPTGIKWAFWQWQGSPLDRDKFNGDLVALRALAGKEPVADPIIEAARTRLNYFENKIESGDRAAAHVHALKAEEFVHRLVVATAPGVPAPTPTPGPTPTPDPPPSPPPPVHPPIPLQPTPAPSSIGPLPTLPETRPILGNHPGVAVGSTGPVFVFVHGGPQPLASTEVQWRLLAEIPQRLAARGARAYAIDYRSDTWRNAVEDVTAGIATVRALVGTSPITVVAHSFGGLPASISVLRDGVGDALVMVSAISSAEGAPQHHADGAPDPVELAALRPSLPVTVVRGQTDLIASLDRKEAFIAALHAAGHPGLNVMGAGGHETLTTDATLDAIFATSQLI